VKQHTCNAIGCRALVLPQEIFCRRHDAMLQSDIRTLLGRRFRPFRRQSQVFNDTLEIARKEILDCQMTGHKTPRPAEFEW